MTEPHLLFAIHDGIARITLNRPEKKNAISPEMLIRLTDAWDEVMERPDIRVVLVTGAGDSFCAGADLGSLIPLLTRARPPEDDWDQRVLADSTLGQKAFLRSTEMTTPIVAAVRGHAVAGGFELLLACDLRVIAEDTRLGLTEVQRGLVPIGGGTTRLSRQIPRALANEILLLGDYITAQEALTFGLVNRVVPPDDVLGCATDLAQRMARNGPLAMRLVKEIMQRADGLPLDDGFAAENQAAAVVGRSDDAKEGPRAFVEKRTPQFTGR